MGSAFGFLTRYFSVLHFCILRHQAAAATLSAGPLGEVSVWEIRSSSALENPEATPCPGSVSRDPTSDVTLATPSVEAEGTRTASSGNAPSVCRARTALDSVSTAPKTNA